MFSGHISVEEEPPADAKKQPKRYSSKPKKHKSVVLKSCKNMICLHMSSVKKFEEEHLEYIPKKMLHELIKELPHVFGSKSSLISINNTSQIHESHKNLFVDSQVLLAQALGESKGEGDGGKKPKIRIFRRKIETRHERKRARRQKTYEETERPRSAEGFASIVEKDANSGSKTSF